MAVNLIPRTMTVLRIALKYQSSGTYIEMQVVATAPEPRAAKESRCAVVCFKMQQATRDKLNLKLILPYLHNLHFSLFVFPRIGHTNNGI